MHRVVARILEPEMHPIHLLDLVNPVILYAPLIGGPHIRSHVVGPPLNDFMLKLGDRIVFLLAFVSYLPGDGGDAPSLIVSDFSLVLEILHDKRLQLLGGNIGRNIRIDP